MAFDDDTLRAIGELLALGEQEGFGITFSPDPEGWRVGYMRVAGRDRIRQFVQTRLFARRFYTFFERQSARRRVQRHRDRDGARRGQECDHDHHAD
jgi:hypothetical protein